MTLDFSPAAVDLAQRVADFLARHVLALEPSFSAGDIPSSTLRQVQAQAKTEGLWAPQLPEALGGRGIAFADIFPILEAAGESLLGPLCLGCAAPDEGNAHLLHKAATPEQREKYLLPLARGELRSTFAMTEPSPGAGSDPRMMRTRAARESDGWVLNGHKWFATGAAGAAFAIVAAVNDAGAGVKDGCTLFIVDAGTPGYRIVREVPALGGGTPGGHCEILLEDCRVGTGQVLGAAGEGFRLMQERLGPARLTHCMRWLGAAKRSLKIAAERAKVREAFGKRLADHQAVQWMLADSATEIHAARLMVADAARKVAAGAEARMETSMCKVFVAEAVNRAIDRAIQVCGSLGISHDLPLAHFYQEARAFRIYDGPSEVHRMVIARELIGRKRGERGRDEERSR
jgi:acyl-CoA dehydrogenase